MESGVQYRYYGKASHMAADLKAQARRVRESRPSLFISRATEEDRTNAETGTTTKVRVLIQPAAFGSGRLYHSLAQRSR